MEKPPSHDNVLTFALSDAKKISSTSILSTSWRLEVDVDVVVEEPVDRMVQPPKVVEPIEEEPLPE